MNNQKGAIQLIAITILLIAGVVTTVFLAKNPQIFKSQATLQDDNSLSLAGTDSADTLSVLEGTTFTVPALIRTNRVINLIAASIRYPVDALELLSIVPSNQLVGDWIDVSIDIQTGTANLIGGIWGDGYISRPGNSDTIAIMEFRAKTGTAGRSIDIRFDDENTRIYEQASGQAVASLAKSPLAITILTPTASPSPIPSGVTATPVCQTLWDRITAHYRTTCTDANFDKISDLDKDRNVNSIDFGLIRQHAFESSWCQEKLDDPTDPCAQQPSPSPVSTVPPVPTITPIPSVVTPTPIPTRDSYSPKILLLVFNPRMGDGRKVSEYFGWNDPNQLTNNLINDIRTASGGVVNYTVVEQRELDVFPRKLDGFLYTPDTYASCAWSGGRNCHSPDLADYRAFINTVDACGKRNRGEIDELWVFGGPLFGYWESNLAGPNAFGYNSSPTENTTCQKLLPIMGFNYERGVDSMFEDFGHRTEATMIRVYGSWASRYGIGSAVAATNWDKFAMLDNQNPGNGGCGNAHTAVNSPLISGAYDWGSTRSVQSSCADFVNYPNLTGAKQTVTCSTWGCSERGFYKDFFFKYFPRGSGINSDGKFNNWWGYLVDPQNTIIGNQ